MIRPPNRFDANGRAIPKCPIRLPLILWWSRCGLALGRVRPQRFVAAHECGTGVTRCWLKGGAKGGMRAGAWAWRLKWRNTFPIAPRNLPMTTLNPHHRDVPAHRDIDHEVPDASWAHHGAKGLGEHVPDPHGNPRNPERESKHAPARGFSPALPPPRQRAGAQPSRRLDMPDEQRFCGQTPQ